MQGTALDLTGRDLLTLLDYSPEEVAYLLEQAKQLKEDLKSGVSDTRLAGKSLGMIFENASTEPVSHLK